MKVVVINGRGGAGKDTFVNMCKRYTVCEAYSSVEFVKQAAHCLGWGGGKSLSDRKFLSELKDLSTWYNDGPFEYLRHINEIKVAEDAHLGSFNQHPKVDILFFFVREPNEISRCVKEFNAKTLLIRRPMDEDNKYGNHADDDVEKFNYDYIIENDGCFEELSAKAKHFVDEILTENELV